MLVLDENLPAAQRLWLRKWRIRFRAVVIAVVASGTTNSNLTAVLHRLANPTFFSLDRKSYGADSAHRG